MICWPCMKTLNRIGRKKHKCPILFEFHLPQVYFVGHILKPILEWNKLKNSAYFSKSEDSVSYKANFKFYNFI